MTKLSPPGSGYDFFHTTRFVRLYWNFSIICSAFTLISFSRTRTKIPPLYNHTLFVSLSFISIFFSNTVLLSFYLVEKRLAHKKFKCLNKFRTQLQLQPFLAAKIVSHSCCTNNRYKLQCNGILSKDCSFSSRLIYIILKRRRILAPWWSVSWYHQRMYIVYFKSENINLNSHNLMISFC